VIWLALCTPVFAEPVSEWSRAITVTGGLGRAAISIRSVGPNPRIVAAGTGGGSGRDLVNLNPGEQLQAADLLSARQELAGETSPWTDSRLVLAIMPAPTTGVSLPPVGFVSRVWQCGSEIEIGGAVPGALVEVAGPAAVLASGPAIGYSARLGVLPQIPAPGVVITAGQAAPPGFPLLAAQAPKATTTVAALPVARDGTFPAPTLAGAPPKGCDSGIDLASVFAGDTVTIVQASNGITQTFLPTTSAAFFILEHPLPTAGDTLRISQGMPNCREFMPSAPLIVDVAPAGTPDTPSITPACPGAAWLGIGNLWGGALVRIEFGGQTFTGLAPIDVTEAPFEVSTLPAGAVVTVTQERCGKVSQPAVMTVSPVGGGQGPDLSLPLYECARAVRVVNAEPGALIQVWASAAGQSWPISALQFAWSPTFQSPVAPYLILGQEVWVVQVGCSGLPVAPQQHKVLQVPRILPEIIPPNIVGDTTVMVAATPGAEINVFSDVGGQAVAFLGSGVIDPVLRTIQLERPLIATDRLFLAQTLCGQTTESAKLGAAPLPADRIFTLPAPLSYPSDVGQELPLVCTAATLNCSHTGEWILGADLDNTSTQADCQFTFSVSVISGSSTIFSAQFDGQLSASGNGPITMTGLRVFGVPPSQDFVTLGNYAPFTQKQLWATVLTSTATFSVWPAWQDYQGGGGGN
jgi:hypothetical protein